MKRMITDTQMLDWMQRHPMAIGYVWDKTYWACFVLRKHFKSLRAAIGYVMKVEQVEQTEGPR